MRRRKQRQKMRLLRRDQTVGLCIPSNESVHTGFALSLAAMVMHTFTTETKGLRGVTIHHMGSSILPLSRYRLSKKAREAGATHLLYIDSDMIFPPDLLLRMLAHDQDMVAINAMARRPPHHTTAWKAPGERLVTRSDSTGIERAWRTGFGAVMLKADVFEGMAAPYFGLEYVAERDDFRGEDYVFFDAAQRAGFELYIDHDLSKQVQHMGDFAYNPLLDEMAAHFERRPTETAPVELPNEEIREGVVRGA